MNKKVVLAHSDGSDKVRSHPLPRVLRSVAIQLPPEIRGLPTIKAKPWVMIQPDPVITSLEGAVFDKDNHLYLCQISGTPGTTRKIFKVTPQCQVSEIFSSTTYIPTGLAFHKDGRLFAACMSGHILIMNTSGTVLQVLEPMFDGRRLAINDLVFDKNGNIYFSEFSGNLQYPTGGVYRLDGPNYDVSNLHQVIGNLAAANGISLSPEGNVLWVSEVSRNALLRISLAADGLTLVGNGQVKAACYFTGTPDADSNRVDSEGNVYQALRGDGRLLILNKYGIPMANVIVPEREKGMYLNTTSLAIKPNTQEGYMVVSGKGGQFVYKFPALATALKLYSHQ
jgi:lactonase